MSMARKLPPFVECWRDRHGKLRLYFRRERGRRIALPVAVKSDEFRDAYGAALRGDCVRERPRMDRVVAGSIGALIVSYKKSREYIALRQTTKIGYVSRLDTLRRNHGHRSIAGLSRERILTGILQPYADRPGASLSLLKMLRILIRHAIAIGWLKNDPSFGIKRPKLSRIRSWTENEIAAFRRQWGLGNRQRTAFELFLNTGQRRSDVVRMTWAHITRDDKISIVQQKTGRKLLIPIHRELREALDKADRSHVAILTTAFGKPFTVDGFSQFMRDAIAAADLPLECQPHGLRKATGRRLAEAGATAKMIMAVLGHTTLSETERYTEEADQIGLAEAALATLDGHKRNGIAQTSSRGLGIGAKTDGETR
jgi:integrase